MVILYHEMKVQLIDMCLARVACRRRPARRDVYNRPPAVDDAVFLARTRGTNVQTVPINYLVFFGVSRLGIVRIT